MKILAFTEKQSTPLKLFIGFIFIGVIGLFDLWSGYEIAFSLFYVLPVSFLAWFTGRSIGLIVSLASALIWLWADAAAGHPYSSIWIPIWNTMIRFSFFVIIVLLLSALKKTYEREAALSRMDNLTGAVNSRFFYELAQIEIDRLQRYRHAFSFAFIDLDNFKTVNDRWGHATGDQVLRAVVNYIQQHIRRTDVLARLGGDEFALLLPEADAEMSRAVCTKIQAGLLEEMRAQQWPVTLSIGVLTCQVAPPSVDELVKRADELMYTVKNGTKNAIKYASYVG
jgi:diguanylate cyclase (GGDEF)-like protein